MENLENRFDSVATIIDIVDIFTIIFLGFAILGIVIDLLRKKKRNYKEVLANFSIGLGNNLLSRTSYGLIFIVTFWVAEQVAFTQIPINIYTWIVTVILADFSYYWMHRIEHKVRFLWAIHSVHHSSTEFDLTTGLRLAWLESLFEWVFFIPMVLLGFDMVQTLVSLLVVVAYQTWIHTEHIGKLGWLDGVINTPSVHRVHHGANPQYIDKNFGGILMIWDRFFGTYQAEEEKVSYGLTKNIGTANPIVINFYEWKSLFKDIGNSKNLKEIGMLILKPPNFKTSGRR